MASSFEYEMNQEGSSFKIVDCSERSQVVTDRFEESKKTENGFGSEG
jgi:hypothetical protein